MLCHVKTEDEAIEIITALTQLYSEQWHHVERIYKWTKCVGIDSIRNTNIENAEKHRNYFELFSHAQTFLQVDPWTERVTGKEAYEFAPMRTFPLAMAAK